MSKIVILASKSNYVRGLMDNLAIIDKEATVIFVICVIVLVFFAIAGVRDIYRRKNDE